MNPVLGLMIESLVAVLLVLTIAYCMLLNKRLQRLKADEHSLKAVIAELVTATEIAERAIGGLKHTVRDVNENLGVELSAAHDMSEFLKKQLAEADHVVRRLSKIALAARPSSAAAEPAELAPAAATPSLPVAPAATVTPAAPARMSSAKAVAAAAHAFTERKRAGGLAA
jgi:preprotein translocase subunit YajC